MDIAETGGKCLLRSIENYFGTFETLNGETQLYVAMICPILAMSHEKRCGIVFST